MSTKIQNCVNKANLIPQYNDAIVIERQALNYFSLKRVK